MSIVDAEEIDFNVIDKEFINIDKLSDDSFLYRAKDVLVQSSWELPIVVQYPGSTIKFDFTTTMGDIVFGIMFIPSLEEGQSEEDMRAETIDEMGRVLSDQESYGGTFTPRCEGVVFFIWDNTHDWYSNKKVSYSIDLQQPSFTHVDKERCRYVRSLLPNMINRRELISIQHADAECKVENLTYKIPKLEAKIHALQTKLTTYKHELEVADAEMKSSSARLDREDLKIRGCCLRMLNKKLVTEILSYLTPFPRYKGTATVLHMDRSILVVCKYWLRIFTELHKDRTVPVRQSNGSHAAGEQETENDQALSLVSTVNSVDGPSLSNIDVSTSPKPRTRYPPAIPLTEDGLLNRKTHPLTPKQKQVVLMKQQQKKDEQKEHRQEYLKQQRRRQGQGQGQGKQEAENGVKPEPGPAVAVPAGVSHKDKDHTEAVLVQRESDSDIDSRDDLSDVLAPAQEIELGEEHAYPIVRQIARKSNRSIGLEIIKKERSTKQLNAWIDLIQREIIKAEKLEHEKRKAYKNLKNWINVWTNEHNNTAPTKVEIKAESGKVWREFTAVSNAMTDIEEYIQSSLDAAKISRLEFEVLAYKRMSENQHKTNPVS